MPTVVGEDGFRDNPAILSDSTSSGTPLRLSRKIEIQACGKNMFVLYFYIAKNNLDDENNANKRKYLMSYSEPGNVVIVSDTISASMMDSGEIYAK
ncbi:hypothetical protein RBH20_18150 [Haloarcula sp. H-GB4]|uniref:hypothetical protein n=1 Tax=Haloarcula sp. H-GB4 TaxID=3069755 RepID=UPI0027B05942|nr:hypothetical protein [Haloarcula sp. H-GB4]MDQ2074458.1 hypothetical protein [Haloarcula sp. H-GB4]